MSLRSILITVVLLLFTAVTLSAASAASAIDVNETATVLDVLEFEDSKGNWTSFDLVTIEQSAPQVAYSKLSDGWSFESDCASNSSGVGIVRGPPCSL